MEPKRFCVAVDFDGTCVEHYYPSVGPDVPHAVEVMRELIENEYNIILWTMRSGKELNDAVQWFMKSNIPLYGVNENPTQRHWTTSKKAYAQVYVDDAALGCPLIFPKIGRPYVDWLKVREWFQNG